MLPDAPPRCRRRSDGRLLGGVATGIAAHLGVAPLHVRLTFAILTFVAGLGPVLYAALWLILPQELPADADAAAPAGLAAASRQGLRPPRSSRRRSEDAGQLVAVAVLGVGALVVVQQLVHVSGRTFWSLCVAALGIALLWRQADEAQRAGWRSAGGSTWRRLFSGGLPTVLRLGVGIVLVVGAAALFLVSTGGPSRVGEALAALLVGLVGLALIAGPWVLRLTADLDEERRERIREQERADMAAHLHDSVLQTLALIQQQAGDPHTVVRLARRQERDLRRWLYGDDGRPGASLRAALRDAAAEVEDAHGISVEVVTVGDLPLDPDLSALVLAAREAMVNAGKHSGADLVDVYAEVDEHAVEVFVRDRGTGFDPAAVPADRLGVRGSIRQRMARHGGEATVRSSPGAGTEVHLRLPRPAAARPGAAGPADGAAAAAPGGAASMSTSGSASDEGESS